MLGTRYGDEFPELAVRWAPDVPPHPELVAANSDLAAELGLAPTWLDGPDGLAAVSGAGVPAGATPVAMAYSGHQFGGYSPLLGDGRAVLLGDLTDAGGAPRELHLKGSGRTPFARGGDGKAVLGPMLREFLVAEAMHALGVRTSRALAVVSTGESVYRDRPLPGAVLARVAASHLRVGTFEYATRRDPELLVRLVHSAIERHYPALAGAENRALGLLNAVIDAQARLVAQWMSVGFVHGVMNTDNVTISGETIDYGPCAFVDAYDPNALFSSIDHGGRYRFGNQPSTMQWNLARFAETLLSQIDGDPERAVELATASLEAFPDRFRHHRAEAMRAKLGLHEVSQGAVIEAADSLLELMRETSADFTSTFRSLSTALRGDSGPFQAATGASPAAAEWIDAWERSIGESRALGADALDRVNPIYIPRNHLLDEALRAAEDDADLAPFERLLRVVTSPFEEQPGAERYAMPAPESFTRGFQTFCGT